MSGPTVKRQFLRPLTSQERAVAEQNHDLVFRFLRANRLQESEYYDVIIFRYLLTVENWFRRPDLYHHQFSTIAWHAMSSALHHDTQKKRRQIKAVSLDDICLDCEDLNDHYEEAMESMLSKESPEERDRHLESLWKELEDVPMNPKVETIEAPFYIFSAGTNREEIWRWFDQHYSRGVAYLLHSGVPAYDPENTPLSQFIRQEVPYRLVEILEIPPEKITPLVIQECVDLLERSADGLFRYDRIEMLLLEVLKDHGLWKGDM